MKHKKNEFKKKIHVISSAGLYRSTEKCYKWFLLEESAKKSNFMELFFYFVAI